MGLVGIRTSSAQRSAAWSAGMAWVAVSRQRAANPASGASTSASASPRSGGRASRARPSVSEAGGRGVLVVDPRDHDGRDPRHERGGRGPEPGGVDERVGAREGPEQVVLVGDAPGAG
jgi:hypothetical protein